MSVIKTTENERNVTDARVLFHIEYEDSESRVRQDTLAYGRVAEGWVRASKN